ncbi:MAG: hypothetical protein ACFB2W_00520 [Leptolyngbyaceae cyanobacterium]
MITNLEQTLSDLRAIATDVWITRALQDALPGVSDAAATRYDDISRTTEYSAGYIGQEKPSGRYRAGVGGDPGYALDTGRMVADLTSPFFKDSGIVIGSDEAYAAQQEKLLSRKFEDGEARYPSFIDDEGYADLAGLAIAQLFEEF